MKRHCGKIDRFVAPLVARVSETQMHESRQLRRAKLTEGIRGHRRLLSAMRFAEDKASSLSVKDRVASRIQELSSELRKMEGELHGLNVQQIREELSTDGT
jgi:hypothetical protein